jgi:hypothetical protein
LEQARLVRPSGREEAIMSAGAGVVAVGRAVKSGQIQLTRPGPKGEGFAYMDMQTLLEFCRIHLQKSDQMIMSCMKNLNDITAIQEKLVNLKSMAQVSANTAEKMKLQQEIHWNYEKLAGRDQYGKPLNPPLNEGQQKALREETQRLEKAVAEADGPGKDNFAKEAESIAGELEAMGQSDMAAAVRNEAKKAMSGNKDDVESFRKSIDAQLSTIGASREMSMVHLQAHVSQRGTMLQMTTNLIAAVNKSADQIAANLGH